MPLPWSRRELTEAGGVLTVAGLVYGLAAAPYAVPPSMDAYYYVDLGRSLAAGHGLTEHFVWNYLPPPQELVHPGSTYWLPLLSVLIAASLTLFGGGYWVERLPGLLCAAAYVALTYLLARRLGLGRRGGLGAAGLVLFNGVWFHDFTGPDAFVPYALLATASLAAQGAGLRHASVRHWVVGGLCAGLASLTRQEGVLLLAAGMLALAVRLVRSAAGERGPYWRAAGAYLAAYLAVWAPWSVHLAAHAAAPGAGLSTLWLRSYDDFYSYGLALSPAYYLAWGWTNILHSKAEALLFLVAFWVFLWQVFLVPLLAVGLGGLRRRPAYAPFLIYMTLLGLALPLLFTFPSRHGTLPHASMSLLAFAACAIMAALERLTQRWPNRARWAAVLVLVGAAAGISLWWADHSFASAATERPGVLVAVAWLDSHAPAGAPAVVDDPPAFAYVSDRPTIIQPSNGLEAIVGAAGRYGARYWVATSGEGPPSAAAGAALGVRLLATLPGGVRVYALPTPAFHPVR